MSANIPLAVQEIELSTYLLEEGLDRIYQGKTRDMFRLGKDERLVVASDRLSIFDFVLNAIVPLKGEVLTALNHFWFTTLLKDLPNHFVFASLSENQGQNAVLDLLSVLPSLDPKRAMVVKTVEILPFELIFRHHIGGSVFKKYLRTGTAGGQTLPQNLPKWSRLEEPLFTPSTKEESGHDINVDADTFFVEYGDDGRKIVEMLKQMYELVYAYALSKGIIILDTKIEASLLQIADEVFTPDSSRFCDEFDWEESMKEGREPSFMDKQPVRNWGAQTKTPFLGADGEKIVGLNNLDPENDEHVAWVSELEVPRKIIEKTTQLYLKIFKRLTGKLLRVYQNENMGITT